MRRHRTIIKRMGEKLSRGNYVGDAYTGEGNAGGVLPQISSRDMNGGEHKRGFRGEKSRRASNGRRFSIGKLRMYKE